MKNFAHWGIKRRIFPEKNYNALWNGANFKTIRFGTGVADQMDPGFQEFYDVAITTRCNLSCQFCYVAAGKGGEHFESISETWKKWMSHPMYFEEKGVRKDDEILQALTLGREIPLDKLPVTYTNKPFQIAIGSTGEPTIHPDFCKFLESVYETNVVPNYTTNGLVLASETKERDALLEATRNFVGGVAVSYGNELARESARKAVSVLLEKGETNVNIHHLIKDKSSVDAMIKLTQEYGDDIKYHVLLPLMQHGRSTEGMEPGTFEYLEDQILKNNIKNVAFGANFVKYLTGPDAKIKTWSYPPESLSANVILKKDQVCITPSSFNLDIIHTIDL